VSREKSSGSKRRDVRRASTVFSLVLAFSGAAYAATGGASPEPAELKPATLEAYNHYIQLTDARNETELRSGKAFLWLDSLPEAQRQALYAQIRNGEVAIERLETREKGKEIHCPSGIIHHWVAAVFIPGATLEQTLALVKDYDHQAVVYAPDVQRSKTLAHEGDDYKIFLRFKRKKVITVVLNANFDVRYTQIDSTRAYSRARSTRIAEVQEHDTPQERELTPGDDGGYLWRMDTYWRFLEQDGGTYVQCEAVSLTRDIPRGLKWLIGPFVTGIPRETLASMMHATRTALVLPSSTPR
jgi:hypothetical protein